MSREFLGRSRKPGNERMRAVMDKSPRAKMYEIRLASDPLVVDDAIATPQDKVGVQRKIEVATFVGKGDGKVVLDMYKRFQLDGALIASKLQASSDAVQGHSVAARQALAEEQRAARLAQKREDDAARKVQAAARGRVLASIS